MGLFVDLPQVMDAHFGVDLCGVQPSVAEQVLDRADVRPILHHVRGT